MKLKFCINLLLLLSFSFVESQAQYKNKLAGKVFIEKNGYRCPYNVFLFKDSTYFVYTECFPISSYSYGAYKYISKDTIMLISKYSNLIDSNYQIKEYKTDSEKNTFKISNINPCSSDQYISIYLYEKNEELHAWENVRFDKDLELHTDTLIKFDNIVIRLNEKYRIDYYLKDLQNNVIELNYDLPSWGYNIDDKILIQKKNGFHLKGYKHFYELIKGKKALQYFLKYFPEPCYLINY